MRRMIMEKSFNAAVEIFSMFLSEILNTSNAERELPAGYILTNLDSVLLICLLKVSTSNLVIEACINLLRDISITVSENRKSVPVSHFTDIVRLPSQVVNLVARVKSWTEYSCALSS